jgi:hypothetical protein
MRSHEATWTGQLGTKLEILRYSATKCFPADACHGGKGHNDRISSPDGLPWPSRFLNIHRSKRPSELFQVQRKHLANRSLAPPPMQPYRQRRGEVHERFDKSKKMDDLLWPASYDGLQEQNMHILGELP